MVIGALLVARYTSRPSVQLDPVRRISEGRPLVSLCKWFEPDRSTLYKVTEHKTQGLRKWSSGNGTFYGQWLSNTFYTPRSCDECCRSEWCCWMRYFEISDISTLTYVISILGYWWDHTITIWLWKDDGHWCDYQDKCILCLAAVECRIHLQCWEVR